MMESLPRCAATAVLLWGVLELRRIRRLMGQAAERDSTARRLGMPSRRESAGTAAKRSENPESPALSDPADPEEQMSAAMLEGFDNLMRYTEKTARGKDGGS